MHDPKGLPFDFATPIGVWFDKSAPEGRQRRIGGLITTDNKDRQQEVVVQKGLDFSSFLDAGWFNDNHSRDTDGIVGYPDKSALRFVKKGESLPNGTEAPGNGHWAEGYLLESARGNRIWDTAQALHKAGNDRRLGFSIEGSIQKRVGPNRKTIAKANVRNVAITNCFPGGVRVVGAAEKVTRRPYSGEMVEIHLSTGEKLTGTPNHPVFTERGWVALGELDKVHDRIGRYISDSVVRSVRPSAVSHDVQNLPPTFDEIFDFVSLSPSSSWVRPVLETDFHGDGKSGEVDIILTDSELRDSLNTAFTQKFGKDALPASDFDQMSLFSDGLRLQRPERTFFASNSGMGSGNQSLSLGGGSTGVSEKLLLVPVSSDTPSFGNVVDGNSGNPATFADAGRALSSNIGFSNIISKRTFDFDGHVYNLDTSLGWYEANGIVVHNCPVNTDTKMEALAKSLQAVEECETPDELWKALGMGTATTGPQTQPAGPQTGETAGQVLAPESLEEKKRKQEEDDEETEKALTPEIAWELSQSKVPGITANQVGQLLELTRKLKAQGQL